MSLSIAMRGALAVVYERLSDGELTHSMGASGYSARTLDALASRELITWYLDTTTWRKSVTLTAAGLAEIAGHFRFCPRCHSTVRSVRRLQTIGFGPAGTRNIGMVIKGPCPCRWHDDQELSR